MPESGECMIDSREEKNKHRNLSSLRTLRKYSNYLDAQEGKISNRKIFYLMVIKEFAGRYV